MNRITPEEVVKAYESTGLKLHNAERCAHGKCGFGVVEKARGLKQGRLYDILGADYTVGFWSGFDDKAYPAMSADQTTERFKDGHADGIACAAAVFGEATTTNP